MPDVQNERKTIGDLQERIAGEVFEAVVKTLKELNVYRGQDHNKRLYDAIEDYLR